MRHLLNTLFVLSEDAYLSKEGENIVIHRDDSIVARYPFHTLESVLCFSYAGASPALMGACAERNIALSFYSPRGKFLCQTEGMSNGNVLLRRKQFRIADDDQLSKEIASFFISGKLYNSKWVLERATRDHAMRVDVDKLKSASRMISELMQKLTDVKDVDSVRGIEGAAAKIYFDLFNELILCEKEVFCFNGRSRRPPMDRINALLSFVYSMLSGDCMAALKGVGLDPYVGFLHVDRPGRASLALDLMEELRPILGDRFSISLINGRKIKANHFDEQENGAVYLNDAGRRIVLEQWQKHKQDTLTHPFLGEKMPWGLVPYVQALLLSRYLRGDLDAYPPFFWK